MACLNTPVPPPAPGLNYRIAQTTHVNFKVPMDVKCFEGDAELVGTSSTFFSVKTNKYVNLHYERDLVFDVKGVWLDDSLVRSMFELTPDHLIGYGDDNGPYTPPIKRSEG